jgi:hypothetical protein
MIDFNALKKNLKKNFSKFKKARIAVLGDSATQLLAQAIRGYGYEVEMDFEIFEADYDQIGKIHRHAPFRGPGAKIVKGADDDRFDGTGRQYLAAAGPFLGRGEVSILH